MNWVVLLLATGFIVWGVCIISLATLGMSLLANRHRFLGFTSLACAASLLGMGYVILEGLR